MVLKYYLSRATWPFLAVLFYICCLLFSLSVKSPLLIFSKTTVTVAQIPQLTGNFNLVMGLLTENYECHCFLSFLYETQSSPLKLLFCNFSDPVGKTHVPSEIIRFNDIKIFSCKKTMGIKAYLYSLPCAASHHYDYMMEADNGLFRKLPPLAISFELLQRKDMYHVFVISCTSMNSFKNYMSDISFEPWDFIKWINDSGFQKHDTFEPQDKLVRKYLNMGMKAKDMNQVRLLCMNQGCTYEYSGANNRCSHEFVRI